MIDGLPNAIFFNIVYCSVSTWFLHVRFSSISMLRDLKESECLMRTLFILRKAEKVDYEAFALSCLI